jgi:hypothetical protein
MVNRQDPQAVRDALQFVLASDMPAQHKAVLIQTLTQAMRDKETAFLHQQAADRVGPSWQADETSQLQSALQGKVARSWQHADELLMRTALQLHRDPGAVRLKATELGLGASVDYALAKRLPRDSA